MTTATATPGETSAERLLAFAGMRRVPSPRIELFDRPGFLPPELCVRLIALIDQDRRPSTIADPNGDHYFRTSETCDLAGDEPAVEDLHARLFALNGIDPAHGEPVQGQRYEVGQEFKAHTDYFEPTGQDFDKFCTVAGQRTWTFMIYLNEVEAGGATRPPSCRRCGPPVHAGWLVGSISSAIVSPSLPQVERVWNSVPSVILMVIVW